MNLHDLDSPESLQSFISSNANTVVCFSATWCGPCTRSKPDLIALADSYAADFNTDVKFGIAYEHKVGNECIQSFGIRAFPSYILFVKCGGQQIGKVEGPNFAKIRMMIESAGCQKEFGAGNSLAGSGDVANKEDARSLRLQRFGGTSASPTDESKPAAESTPDQESKPDTSTATTEDVEMKDVTDTATEETDPTANLDKSIIDELTTNLGFPLIRAQKGLLFGEPKTLEGAVEWIVSHQDDGDIDDPIPCQPVAPAPAATGAVQSYKCNECGKTFSNMANLELHANKTGHSDFSESTEAAKQLTPEEKAAKVQEIKQLLKAKRAEREDTEKKDELEREKQRRFMGKEMIKTQEQMQIEKRKRDAALRKKEKDDAKKERERIRHELAKDKAERMANKGKLSSKLGIDGYNPDGIQYEVDDGGADSAAQQQQKAAKASANAGKIDEYIKKISSYRAGGDGGKCLKILLAYVGNVADKDDEKFKTINMENKIYKTKVKPFIGAKFLLLAVGFEQNSEGNTLTLKEDADKELLKATKIKLQVAFEKY